jgi:predicted NAD/FAD-binding protein
VAVITDHGRDTFDHVILACHSDQALALLPDASPAEREVLSAIPYQPNRAYLHLDPALMPRRRRAWASWNYLSAGRFGVDAPGVGHPSVAVTYWLNRLQPLPFKQPVFVTLNPPEAPRPDLTLQVMHYDHPVFDLRAIAAQARLPEIQGQRNTWFAGAWAGYGFHEDGLKAGLAAAQGLLDAEQGQPQRPAAMAQAA